MASEPIRMIKGGAQDAAARAASDGGAPRPPEAAKNETAALLRLMQIEADLRRQSTERELIFHLANDTRAALGFRQCFLLRRHGAGFRLEAASSVATIERNAPLNRWVEAIAGAVWRSDASDRTHGFAAADHGAKAPQPNLDYAFPHMLWTPLKTAEGEVFAAALFTREQAWPDTVVPLADRLAEAYAHAWRALAGKGLQRRGRSWAKRLAPVLLIALLAAGFLKAPLSTLAPAEIVGRDAAVIAAPLDGVVSAIAARPNTPVKAGDVLFTLDDTELQSAFDIAERAVLVADARVAQLEQGAFFDAEAAGQIAVAKAELTLAQSERDLAAARLARATVRAPADGVAILQDPKEWIGRPVAVGERIMEVADPAKLEVSIALPVSDAIVLRDGADVTLYMDRDPLNPLGATARRASYQASPQPDGSLAFTFAADLDPDAPASLPIGARGVAQLWGEEHSIHFILFRRPLIWLRQTFGL